MMKSFWLILALSITTLAGFTQSLPEVVRNYRKQHEWNWMKRYLQFLSIPNESKDISSLQRNADYLKAWMTELGLETQFLFPNTPSVAPAVVGKKMYPGVTKTLAFYAHYDGQPVNPEQWAKALSPFQPVFLTAPIERGGQLIPVTPEQTPLQTSWRLSGRGSADDKAGIMTILNAYEALQHTKFKPTYNLIFFFEGEEESGSQHLGEIFERYKEQLKADCWIIADGPRHVSGRKVVQFGVRGDVNLSLTTYGAKRPLHSGNYGNWAPNPARLLTQLLAAMKDESGRVTIPGFYDDVTPLTPAERQAIAAIPNIEQQLKDELAVNQAEGRGESFLELLHLPTLNINGIQSGAVGEKAANVIPVKAEAVLDLRLVLGNDVDRQINKVVDFIRSKGYQVLDHDPTDEERRKFPLLIKITRGDGYNAQRTPLNLPIAQAVLKAVQQTSAQPVIALPSAGGSLPLIVFEKILGAKVITVPVVNYDNNQHAENENVELGYLWEGIETFAALMRMP